MGTQAAVKTTTPTLDRLSARCYKQNRRAGLKCDESSSRANLIMRSRLYGIDYDKCLNDLADYLRYFGLSSATRCVKDAAALMREVA